MYLSAIEPSCTLGWIFFIGLKIFVNSVLTNTAYCFIMHIEKVLYSSLLKRKTICKNYV